MKNRLQEDLYDYCRWNQEDEVSQLLRKNPKILDVTEDEGLLFYLGIKHKNVSMLSSLLRYFEDFQLNIETKGISSLFGVKK